MNSKKCKKLRKVAGGNKAVYGVEGSPARYATVHGTSIKVSKSTPRTLDKGCSKYIYKQLKKS